MKTTRRTTLLLSGGIGLAAVLALVPATPGPGGHPGAAGATPESAVPSSPEAGRPSPSASQTWDGTVHVLGDGSTSDTGPEPKQLVPQKLKPGEKPPQFVVFSWDGALEGDERLFSHFLQVAEQSNAQMTFFLAGIYLLPKSKRYLYHPPQHPVGTSAIDLPTDQHIKDTLAQLRQAWADGDEIGTHFNGHFCKPAPGGGDTWSSSEWLSETQQAYSFVENWKTNTGYNDIPPLPFDYQKELVGGRAPCLEGQTNLLPVEKQLGWRYDASSPGEFQIWPTRTNGIWNFPLQQLPYPKKNFQFLSMDFNLMANQSGDNPSDDTSKYPGWEKETRDGYLNGFERAYNGSRAPLFIGNHFETWNGGIYMKAVEDVMRTACTKPDVRCVSFKELADWLDVQDPSVLARLRTLDPGQAPDWASFVKK
ncbi:hypothetical protein F7Q99_29525 [Streptomyces kaniharaensis]|uniref:Lipoprotein n=1 Tax=Streptomyces kaniharaensis TaxID=212423 RepID=A0A6N7L087_9ACTN|nr:hypothetical protein [Streptomyces kaniharaensis]MQS16249.1 hypothetical protein [Streptomyces kaniharaensis]